MSDKRKNCFLVLVKSRHAISKNFKEILSASSCPPACDVNKP